MPFQFNENAEFEKVSFSGLLMFRSPTTFPRDNSPLIAISSLVKVDFLSRKLKCCRVLNSSSFSKPISANVFRWGFTVS